MLRLVYEGFLNILAPRTCLVCESFLVNAGEHNNNELSNYICQRCFDRLPPAPRSEELLAGIARHFTGDSLAIQSITARFQRETARIDFATEDDNDSTSITPLLYALKYHGVQRLGRALGRELGQLLQMFGQTSYTALVPVPIHSARERERGYNQSTRIAEGIADVLHLPVETAWIRRHTYTLSQTNFSIEERKLNVHSAFAVGRSPEAIKGASLLLVDDILTTGSTLNACAATLLEHGARRIDAATVAKA